MFYLEVGKDYMSENLVESNSVNNIALLDVSQSLPSLSLEEQKELQSGVLNVLEKEQVDIPIEHFIHDGVYSRTCKVPAGVVIAGALLKIPTTVVVSGDCLVSFGLEPRRIIGHAVLRGEAGRRQFFVGIEDTYITMYFKTDAKTTEEAEREMTDEFVLLTNHREELDKLCHP